MKAILKLIPWQTILEFVITSFLGVLPSVWTKAKDLVTLAEERFPTAGSGADRKAWVLSELKIAYGGLKQHVYDAVVGLAVEMVKKKFT